MTFRLTLLRKKDTLLIKLCKRKLLLTRSLPVNVRNQSETNLVDDKHQTSSLHVIRSEHATAMKHIKKLTVFENI